MGLDFVVLQLYYCSSDISWVTKYSRHPAAATDIIIGAKGPGGGEVLLVSNRTAPARRY